MNGFNPSIKFELVEAEHRVDFLGLTLDVQDSSVSTTLYEKDKWRWNRCFKRMLILTEPRIRFKNGARRPTGSMEPNSLLKSSSKNIRTVEASSQC